MMEPIQSASNEILDGLKEIKNFFDPKGLMSDWYFRKHLLPGLKDAILMERKGWAKQNEKKYWCFKSQLMAYLLKLKKF